MSRWDFRKERWVRVRVVWRGEAWVLVEAGEDEGGVGLLVAFVAEDWMEVVREAAAGEVAQEVWRLVRRCWAVVLSCEKSVLMRSMTNSAGFV